MLIKLKSEEKFFYLYYCDECFFFIVDRCIFVSILLNFILIMYLFSVLVSNIYLYFFCL